MLEDHRTEGLKLTPNYPNSCMSVTTPVGSPQYHRFECTRVIVVHHLNCFVIFGQQLLSFQLDPIEVERKCGPLFALSLQKVCGSSQMIFATDGNLSAP